MNFKESREKMKEIWIAAMLIQVSAAQNINIIGGKVFFKVAAILQKYLSVSKINYIEKYNF